MNLMWQGLSPTYERVMACRPSVSYSPQWRVRSCVWQWETQTEKVEDCVLCVEGEECQYEDMYLMHPQRAI